MNAKTKKASKATTKKASAKPAPKIRAKISATVDGYGALKCVHRALETLPCRLLPDLCKAHDVPVAKYKDEQVNRLADRLVNQLGRKVVVTIG